MFFNELTYTIKVPEEFLSMNDQLHSVRLSYGCDVFEKDVNIPINNEQEFLGFYFNLASNLHYSFGDSLSGTLHQGQYIFIYLPGTHAEFGFKKGKYSALGFHFTPELLRSLARDFPFLDELLHCIELKRPCCLTESPLQATGEMIRGIKDILLYNTRWEMDRNIHFFSRIFDILTLCLQQISIIKSPTYKNGHFEMPKVEETRNYLVDHLQNHFTLSLLANRVGMEKHTLARAFKKVYGKTIMDFLTDERMNEAMILLRDSTMTLQRIAKKVGYKNHTHFTKAFKRKHNVTPSVFRHNAVRGDESPSIKNLSLK
jgi:AraC-like DNA-binding protein